MKKLFLIFIVIPIIGCQTNQKPDKETVLKIINDDLNFPRTIDYEIFCSDPAHAKKLLDLKLDEKRMVTIQKTQKLKDIGSPMISFTKVAQPYLIKPTEKEKRLDIQKVKIAEETISDIKLGNSSEYIGKTSIPVTYTVTCTNITPFSVLMKRDLSKPITRSGTLLFIDGKWKLMKP
ncbi:hypothetical protein Q763_09705 [Flavobacterium beibuense F44-8]|uniref:Uncharacterized protein n=1 Tax=Flavobacterium beibuense F44-8 TaxID=1406840 RepID=A0A0A2LN89_9FLAO|nr:hypothetical protein [Flavobacterium beibuense]KGO80801.1 hypothetical protein Q763_09705 [Flavobacterium beibuense F44-8]